MSDPFASWRDALVGGKPGIHEGEPWCGYFKMRDRRGLNMNKQPRNRPFIACAIWKGQDGEFKAEIAGTLAPLDRVWPWCAKEPITYEAYAYWHQHGRWPEMEKTA